MELLCLRDFTTFFWYLIDHLYIYIVLYNTTKFSFHTLDFATIFLTSCSSLAVVKIVKTSLLQAFASRTSLIQA